jgi:hypothetical protein
VAVALPWDGQIRNEGHPADSNGFILQRARTESHPQVHAPHQLNGGNYSKGPRDSHVDHLRFPKEKDATSMTTSRHDTNERRIQRYDAAAASDVVYAVLVSDSMQKNANICCFELNA